MTVIEQNIYKTKSYNESLRYINNAKESLKKAGKVNGRYKNMKYVKTACGTAYNAVLIALDAYLFIKDVRKPVRSRISIDYYKENISKFDKKLLASLHDVYEILHLSGYYDGITRVDIVQAGLEDAMTIIDKIKPNSKN